MNGNGPRQAQRELLEGAQQSFRNFFGFGVQRILAVGPLFTVEGYQLSVFGFYLQRSFVGERHDSSQHTVIIPVLPGKVVLDEHHLGTDFQHQLLFRRIHVSREIIRYHGTKCPFGSRELLQAGSIQVVGFLIMSCQIDIATRLAGSKIGQATAVEPLQYRSIHPIVANAVQQIEKLGIVLAIDLGQLHRHITGLLQRMTAEEIKVRIIGRKQLLVLLLDDGRQLLQVTYQEQLHSAERLVTVTVPAQHVVDGIEQIGPHHTDFVNDQQVDTTHDVDFLLAEAILVSGLSSEMGLGDEGRERQLEKGMDGDASRIHGRHTGRSQHNHTLGRPLTETA